jgi:hypothetical protein
LLRHGLLDEVQQGGLGLRREANAHVVHGLIALEAGQVEESAEALRRALAAWRSPEDAAAGAGVDFTGRAAAQECLRRLTGGRAGPAPDR